jgi:hypothetical protein
LGFCIGCAAEYRSAGLLYKLPLAFSCSAGYQCALARSSTSENQVKRGIREGGNPENNQMNTLLQINKRISTAFAIFMVLAALLTTRARGQSITVGCSSGWQTVTGGGGCVIDDFTTGLASGSLSSGVTSFPAENGDPQHLAGGARAVGITFCQGCNPYNQPTSFTVKANNGSYPPAFIYNSPLLSGTRLQIDYGDFSAMNLNLGVADTLRVNFQGVDRALNFNVQLFTGTGYGQGGCNIVGPVFGPTSVDLPLANFVQQGSGFIPGDVTRIALIHQAALQLGTPNLVINSIQAVKSGTPTPSGTPPVSCHY